MFIYNLELPQRNDQLGHWCTKDSKKATMCYWGNTSRSTRGNADAGTGLMNWKLLFHLDSFFFESNTTFLLESVFLFRGLLFNICWICFKKPSLEKGKCQWEWQWSMVKHILQMHFSIETYSQRYNSIRITILLLVLQKQHFGLLVTIRDHCLCVCVFSILLGGRELKLEVKRMTSKPRKSRIRSDIEKIMQFVLSKHNILWIPNTFEGSKGQM